MKNLYLLFITIYFTTRLTAQSQGPIHGTSFAVFGMAGSNKTWTNASNVASSDNVYSDFGNITGGAGSYTDYLVVTDFGFSIPLGAIVKGIVVEVERSDPNGLTSDYRVRITKSGSVGVTIGNTERSTGAAYPAADAYQSYGNSNDLWGESWTSSTINASGFGVAIAARRTVAGGTTAGRVDDIRITVHYTFTTLPVHLASFSATRSSKEVIVKWKTADETNMSHYKVERSLNGRDFTVVHTTPSQNNAFETNYSYTDHNPVAGTSYYRLKMAGNTGDTKYSSIVTINFNDKENVELYPNLLISGQMINFNNPKDEELTIRFYTANGKQVARVTTISQQLSPVMLEGQKGVIFYHVFKSNGEMAGRGRLMLQY